MRIAESIRVPGANGRISLGQKPLEGYELRLIQWGCFNCNSFEQRVFSSRAVSEELDCYAICRHSGEPIDLINEANSCPKCVKAKSDENKSKSGRRRLPCVKFEFAL